MIHSLQMFHGKISNLFKSTSLLARFSSFIMFQVSVTVTPAIEHHDGIITLESNPSRGPVLPAPHGKGNKCDKNVKYKRTDALSP